ERYVEEMYRHMWAEPKKMDDPEVVQAAIAESQLPGEVLLAGIQDPAIKKQLIDNTASSVERGVFGSPSFFVGDELFFGKDKLVEVEEEIERQTG
ncbi:MAG: DsbA family protein, partial [Acidobacteriota bacterium]